MSGRLSPNRVTKALEARCIFLRGKIKTRQSENRSIDLYADELDALEQALDAFVVSKTTGTGYIAAERPIEDV